MARAVRAGVDWVTRVIEQTSTGGHEADPKRPGAHTRREVSARGDSRRNQILQAAVELFGEVGYQGTSLRDIAQRVGITHPGLLYHFHSKEELLLEVLARREQENRIRFHMDADLTAVQQLGALVDLVAHNASRQGLVELFSTLSAEATAQQHPAHTYFTLRYEMLADRNTRLFQQLADEGLLRAGISPQAAARGLVALMDGLQVQWLYDQTGVDMSADLRAHLDALLVRPLAELLAEQDQAVATDPAA